MSSSLVHRARRLAFRAFGSPLVLDVVHWVRPPPPPPPPPPAPEPPPPPPPPYVPLDRPLGAQDGKLETLEDEIHEFCFVEGKYPEGWPVHGACPCCGGADLRPSFEKYGLRHAECGACRFVFLQPYPPPGLLDRLYNASYYPAVRRFIELPKAKAGDRAALFSFPEESLERIIAEVGATRTEGRWLELGGGLGHFAHLAQTKLPGWKVVLSDMNRDSLRFAAETYGLETLDSAPGTLRQHRFHAISMIASLEHVPEPLVLLRSLVELLEPGGLLILGVPRFSPLNRAASKDGSASVVPPYHVSHFDEHNLPMLLSRIADLDPASFTSWQDKPNAFKLTDLVKTWPYWRIEVPTSERDTPRTGMIKPYSDEDGRWLAALAAADNAVEDLIHRLDGGLNLTVIARRRDALR